MKKLKEPDWQKKIVNIQKKGLTQTQIEMESGINQRTVSKIKLGLNKRISWVIGNAILKLETKLRGK